MTSVMKCGLRKLINLINKLLFMKYITPWIAAICIIVFILQSLFPLITDIFVLVSSDVLARPWIIFTSMFLHGSITHLIYNMFALVLFGLILERILGTKRFTMLYFVSGLVAGIGATIFYNAALGASGAIYGILGCLAVLRPGMRVYVGYIPMPMAIAAVLWVLGDLVGMFAPSGVANAAHLFGIFFGIAAGFYYRKDFGEKIIKRKIIPIPESEMRRWEDKWM